MNISRYQVIFPWVFQRVADWQELGNPDEHITCRATAEARSFFEYNPSKAVYIIEEPTTALEKYNQGFLPQLKEIAKEFDVRFLHWDTREARRFYIARAKAEAKKFETDINPFWVLTFRF